MTNPDTVHSTQTVISKIIPNLKNTPKPKIPGHLREIADPRIRAIKVQEKFETSKGVIDYSILNLRILLKRLTLKWAKMMAELKWEIL